MRGHIESAGRRWVAGGEEGTDLGVDRCGPVRRVPLSVEAAGPVLRSRPCPMPIAVRIMSAMVVVSTVRGGGSRTDSKLLLRLVDEKRSGSRTRSDRIVTPW